MSWRLTALSAGAGFFLLLTVTAWFYAPGVSGPAMLDDISSVLVLDSLRDDSKGAVDAIFADRSGPLGRPVSIATFVAERVFLDAGLAFSKVVNIALHLVNTVLWFLVFLRLLSVSNPGFPVIMVSMLCAALWAASPLFVSTVLYSVQRMAMLSCFFMLLATLAYVSWRKAYFCGSGHVLRALVVCLFAVLAVLSKETGIVVVPILVALECLWFRWRNPEKGIDKRLRNGSLGVLAAGGIIVVVVLSLFPDVALGSYRHLDFSPYERLSAQAGILWEYLGQVVFPDTSMMGIHHDDATIVEYAGGDGSNLPGILGWTSLLLIAPFAYTHELSAKIVFCALFFLIGHSTESTFLPLELYYEHRNYFPAGGIFLLLALVLTRLVSAWPRVGTPVCIYLCCAWLLLASRSSALVQVWSNESLLRVFHIAAHPNSYRANSDMASELAGRGELSAALKYSAVAQELGEASKSDHLIRDLALSCMAGEALPPEGRLGQKEKAQALHRLNDLNTMRVMIRYLQAGACDEEMMRSFSDDLWLAYGNASSAMTGQSPDIYTLLAILENANANFRRAMFYSDQLLQSRPGDVRGLLMRLHFATRLGDEQSAKEAREELLLLEEMNKLDANQRSTLQLYLPVSSQ